MSVLNICEYRSQTGPTQGSYTACDIRHIKRTVPEVSNELFSLAESWRILMCIEMVAALALNPNMQEGKAHLFPENVQGSKVFWVLVGADKLQNVSRAWKETNNP